MSVLTEGDWILTSEQMPPREAPESEYSEAVDVVEVWSLRRISILRQAKYSFVQKYWVSLTNSDDVFGESEGNWVTHWRKLSKLPELLPVEDIQAYARSLEPDYKRTNPFYRAVFPSLRKGDEGLQEDIVDVIATTTSTTTRKAPVKGQGLTENNEYYIDFAVPSRLSLRRVRRALQEMGVAHTIQVRDANFHIRSIIQGYDSIKDILD